MGRAVFHRFLRIARPEKSVDEPRCKAIAAANPVENLEVLAMGGLEELPVSPAYRAPVVDSRGLYGAKGGGCDLEVGKRFHGFRDHGLELLDLDRGNILVHSLHLEAKTRREILLVPNHYVHVPRNASIDLLGFFTTSDGFP